ncbi:ferritin-like domain-containing protein [Euzebya tangerina]|uniref:ferritin-like domain-containing protein n=1 Tax=Euzebya tangerina TaxID=591198 RepID=UPI000E31F409|nr:PA2169 family four-helix-bundle protein [Euzebya tangerina]
MSSVLKDLVETLEDGKKGMHDAADKLAGDGHTSIADVLRRFSSQRAEFSEELRTLASSQGQTLEESGSLAGSLHRGWMGLKDALSGSDPSSVLKAVESGEEHAVSEYEDALNNDDLPETARPVVTQQLAGIRSAKSEVDALTIS